MKIEFTTQSLSKLALLTTSKRRNEKTSVQNNLRVRVQIAQMKMTPGFLFFDATFFNLVLLFDETLLTSLEKIINSNLRTLLFF